MTTVVNAALAASVMVGLLSIPAVSQTADGSETFNSPETTVSNSEIPETVSRSISPNRFTASVETAFDSFATSIGGGQVNATLENPESKLRVHRTSTSTKWVLKASSGTLTLRQSPNRYVETVDTPMGTLEIVYADGGQKTSFSGSNRESVEQTAEELKVLMDKKKERLEERTQSIREQATPDVDIVLNESTASGFDDNSREHVVIVNNDDKTVDLHGWEIENNDPSRFELENVELESGESIRVFTSSEDVVGSDGVYSSGLTWENGGDTASIYNSQGIKVSESSY